MKAEKPEKHVEKKKKKTTQADVSVEIYSFINRLQCERHKTGVEGQTKKRCGWPKPRKPATQIEEPPKEKLVLPEDEASHVTREDTRAIVSNSVFEYLVAGGSFSAESLEEVLQLFFTHSSLTHEQLGWQFQRANSRSLKGFLAILESREYPEDCLFLGKQKREDDAASQQEALQEAKEAVATAVANHEKANQAVSDAAASYFAASSVTAEPEAPPVAAAAESPAVASVAPSIASPTPPVAPVAHTSSSPSAVESSAASSSPASPVVSSSTRHSAAPATVSGTVLGAASPVTAAVSSPSVTRAVPPVNKAASSTPTPASSSASPSASRRAASVPGKTPTAGSSKNSTHGSRPPASASSVSRSQSASAASSSSGSKSAASASSFSGSESASSASPSISSGASVPRPPSQSLKRKQPDDSPDLLALENRARRYLERYRVGEYPELMQQIGALELYVDTVAGYRTMVDEKSEAMTRAIANEGEERFRVFVENLSRTGPKKSNAQLHHQQYPMTPPSQHRYHTIHASHTNLQHGYHLPPQPGPIPYMQQYLPPQAVTPSPPVNYATPPRAAPPRTKQERVANAQARRPA